MADLSFGRALLIVMLAMILTVARAKAEQPGSASIELGPWLVGVNAGAVFPMATSFSGKGAIGGLNVTAAGNLNFRPGPTFTGFTSYEPNNYVAVAGQLGYATTEFDNFQGTLSLAGVGSITNKFAVSGHSDIVYGFLDGIITPLGGSRIATFVPFFGGGIGFASSTTTFGSVALPGATLPVGITESRHELRDGRTCRRGLSHQPTGIFGARLSVRPGQRRGLRRRRRFLGADGCAPGERHLSSVRVQILMV